MIEGVNKKTKYRILIDLQEMKDEGAISIGVWISRLLNVLPNNSDVEYILQLREGVNDRYESELQVCYPQFKILVFRPYRGACIYGVKTPLWYINQKRFNRMLIENNIDCVFIPSNGQGFTLFQFPCKRVIVIHDLKAIKGIRKSYKERKSWYNHIVEVYAKSIDLADKVIAISGYTKQDILTLFPNIPEEKVAVVYNSVVLAEKSLQPINFVEQGYILYVNTLHPYKNILTLLKAFNRIKEQTDKKLVVVGRRTPFYESQCMPYIREHLEGRVIQMQSLGDEELRYVYEHASLFVSTSLHEGFGYTPIEAAICQIPVICTLQEALPDVTEGLVDFYYPAIDYEALAVKILQRLQSPLSKAHLSDIATHYTEKYSPCRQAEQLEKILLDVMHE